MGRRLAGIGFSLLFGAALSANAVGQGVAIPNQGGTEYLNGGIGKEQADLMRDKSAQFPVRMTFSEHVDGQDAFVADIHLRVIDGQGRTVLDLPAQGPIFLLRLPPGSYAVEAEHGGQVKSQRFEVAAGRHENLVFSWS